MTPAIATEPERDEPGRDVQNHEAEDVQAVDQDADHGVSVNDVIKDAEFYTAQQIENLLGLDPRLFFAAEREHSGTIFTEVKGSGEYVELRGSQILRWLRESGIDAEPTPDTVDAYRRARRVREPAAPVSPEPKQKPTIVDKANAIEKTDREAMAAWKNGAADAYFALVRRSAIGKEGDRDATALHEMMQDPELSEHLGLTSESIASDIALIRSAIRQQQLHREVTTALKQLTAARAARIDMEKRHKREVVECRKVLSKSNGDFTARSKAGYELEKLARQRPAFFTSDNPPSLREPAKQ